MNGRTARAIRVAAARQNMPTRVLKRAYKAGQPDAVALVGMLRKFKFSMRSFKSANATP